MSLPSPPWVLPLPVAAANRVTCKIEIHDHLCRYTLHFPTELYADCTRFVYWVLLNYTFSVHLPGTNTSRIAMDKWIAVGYKYLLDASLRKFSCYSGFLYGSNVISCTKLDFGSKYIQKYPHSHCWLTPQLIVAPSPIHHIEV